MNDITNKKDIVLDKNKYEKITIHFISGTISALLAQLICFPIDTIKNIYQHNTNETYYNITRKIYKNGIKNFWKGIAVPSFGIINGISFSTYYILHNDKWAYNHILYASLIASFLQLIPRIPSEVIKIRLQQTAFITRDHKITLIDLIKSIYQLQGYRGFYKGALAQTSRDVPNNMVYFFTYEKMGNFINNEFNLNPILKTFISGGLSGIIAWVIVIPMDFYKTRIQSGADKNLSHFYNNVFQNSKISLLRGGSTSTLFVFILNGFILTFYEKLTPLLNKIK